MKQKLIVLFTTLLLTVGAMAQQGRPREPFMCKEEFDAKREQFITTHAGLTKEEATSFFPIYNECQKKRHDLNDQIWRLRRETKGKELSEEEYKRILEQTATLRVQIEQLEQEYLPKFRAVIPYKKIFAVKGAEARFQRELLDKIHRDGRKRNGEK